MKRAVVLISVACLLALAGCGGDGDRDDAAARDATPDVDYATRWWNALSPEQMVAALFGDMATADQAVAAKKMYADLDDDTKALVNAAADEIYDPDAGYASVGDWWETLDCRLMRVAAGDGITADPMSPYCAHYPGSGFARILSVEAKMHVDYVGMALLGRDDPGLFVPFVGRGTHGIGTTLAYVTVHEDGTTEPSFLEYTGYGMHRGRDVLVVQDSQSSSCSTQYWDLETGNWMVCLDADGGIRDEQIPHVGVHAFPMVEGTSWQWTSAYCEGGCPPDAGTFWAEFTVEACGIELEVAAGTFTVCRIVATDASWYEGAGIGAEDVDWVVWYDPAHDLEVKRRYIDPWTDQGVTELSAYELVE